MAQSGLVAAEIRRVTGREVELVEIVTTGDRSSAPVKQLGVGVFVSALRDALSAKEIDLAVHSYKDLPTAPPADLVVAAVPERGDPRDALVARDGLTLTELPSGSRIGTGSLRRMAQLYALGLPVEVVPVRGNVDTRLGKVTSGELEAVVLARSGLARLGRADEITEILDPLLMLPAPAQGALAVECRAEDTDLIETLALLDHPHTHAAVTAERALLAKLEAGCSAPVAGLAVVAEGDSPDATEIYLRGAVLSVDGRVALRLSRTGTLTAGAELVGAASSQLSSAAAIGRQLAEDLLDAGAETVLGVQNDPHP
jgi:hydroxymethylbilane synthase